MEDKIKLVYILSNGRSGSTVLDMMLGCLSGFWTLGEVQNLEWDILNNRVCGSGEKIAESDFWSGLLPEVILEDKRGSISHFRKRYKRGKLFQSGKVLRFNLLKNMLFNKASESKEIISGYGSLNYELLELVKRHAEDNDFKKGISSLVDASKDPYRLAWLQESGLFSIKVIHLIKEPRSFVFSTGVKHQKNKRAYWVFRMSVRWVLENWVMRFVCEKYFDKSSYYVMKYEDLASSPIKEINRSFHKLKLDYPTVTDLPFRDYMNYGVSGNKSRRENKPIYLDETWKSEMPLVFKTIAKIITSPFLFLYRSGQK